MNHYLIVIVLVIFAGCTHQQVYDAVQEGQKAECQRLPDTRYEECMAQFVTPYDEYEASRESLRKESTGH